MFAVSTVQANRIPEKEFSYRTFLFVKILYLKKVGRNLEENVEERLHRARYWEAL